MKILSIDIGIKNLGYCIIENDNNIINKEFKICDWNIINICNSVPSCCFCKKNAKFKKNEQFFCKQHIKHSEFKISEINLNTLNKLKIKDLIQLIKKCDINLDANNNSKNECIKIIKDYVTDNYLEEITFTNANNINLIELGINLNNELNKLFNVIDLKTIDIVLLENQISPIANRMKTLQGMIAQYFIINNIHKIEFISSVNKLKFFIENKKTTYNERKKLGIQFTKDILIKQNMDELFNFFIKNNKKDDLADSFLQGLYYLIDKEKITLKNLKN